MRKGVLDFKNFVLSVSVNEAEIANPASARFDLLLNKTREFSSGVQSAADASASPSAARRRCRACRPPACRPPRGAPSAAS